MCEYRYFSLTLEVFKDVNLFKYCMLFVPCLVQLSQTYKTVRETCSTICKSHQDLQRHGHCTVDSSLHKYLKLTCFNIDKTHRRQFLRSEDYTEERYSFNVYLVESEVGTLSKEH